MDSTQWQREFHAAPSVFLTFDADGALSNVYESHEAAELERAWHARQPVGVLGDRRYRRVAVREVKVHSLDLSRRRWA